LLGGEAEGCLTVDKREKLFQDRGGYLMVDKRDKPLLEGKTLWLGSSMVVSLTVDKRLEEKGLWLVCQAMESMLAGEGEDGEMMSPFSTFLFFPCFMGLLGHLSRTC
jgi:hypothetical protein